MLPHDAFFLSTEQFPATRAAGRVAAGMLKLCPPWDSTVDILRLVADRHAPSRPLRTRWTADAASGIKEIPAVEPTAGTHMPAALTGLAVDGDVK
jgi:hypothetical protein